MNREKWLSECIQQLRPDFETLCYPLPEKIRASCSWPSKSGLAIKKRRLGEAWSAENSADQSCEVFISPVLKDPVEVAAVLVHELVHCAVGVKEGHKGKFPRLAKAVGLEGKMTATEAGETLKAHLQEITDDIGLYPHAELTHPKASKKQSCRLLPLKCPECGYLVRTTKKWIEVGLPVCPCGTEMEPEDA